MSPILSVLLFVTLAMAIPPIPAPSTVECTINSQCPSSHCCLLGPLRYSRPVCMILQPKGEQCRVNAETITTNLTYPDHSRLEVKDIHYILCPCANGLSCDPKQGICN